MSALFPISAPRFTNEDERREQETLSPLERSHALQDIRGQKVGDLSNYQNSDLPQLENAFALVEEELLMIPVEEKDAYLQALIHCPELVATESDKHLFLICDNFDTRAATKRLVKYWETRRNIFGENAFLPLRLEDGALTPEDVEHVETGTFCLLPEDEHGRFILYHDRSRLDRLDNLSHISVIRSLWYILHVALEKDSFRENGLVGLMTSNCSISLFSRKHMRLSWDSLINAIPTRLKAFHICHASALVNSHVLPIWKRLVNKNIRMRVIVHRKENSELLLDLLEYGFRMGHLPAELGGHFKIDFQSFLEERRRREDYQRRLDDLQLRIGFHEGEWATRLEELHISLHHLRQSSVSNGRENDSQLEETDAWVEERLDEYETELDDWEGILWADMEAEVEELRETIEQD
eukprot:CAMPEP_0195281926 /NCGR_PEP_ID=MMETSP0707-20130614/1028_1 /TAXON_ID=33640 /ORGANISM="Asterionellopsis glacialis, Strain CCMP134" /LENGTH=408 /DNA_ID=CAMNT_0040340857 /DNA_START=125 /DNA_END=1348 /DNA_ORIENTATION=-